MTMTHRLLSLAMLCPLLGAAATAFAQSPTPIQTTASVPRWTLGVAFGGVHDTGNGALFSVTKTRGSNTGLILETTGPSAKHLSFVGEFGIFDAVSLLGGARWSTTGRTVRAFGQLIAGPVLLNLERTPAAVQPGAGVEVTFSDHLAVKVGIDYRAMWSGGQHSRQTRWTGGVIYRSGG